MVQEVIVNDEEISQIEDKENRYKILISLLEDSIKFEVEDKEKLIKYQLILSLNELLLYKPFIIIEELNEIYKIIQEGLKLEESLKIEAIDKDLSLKFNVFYSKIYSNTIILKELEKDANTTITVNYLLNELKSVKNNFQDITQKKSDLKAQINDLKKNFLMT